MKNQCLLSILTLLFLSSATYAQEGAADKKGKLSVTDVFIQLGTFTERTTDGSLADFRTLAPQSIMLNDDLSDFSSSGGTTYNGNTMLSISLGLQFRDEEKNRKKGNPLLRLGFTYLTGSVRTAGLFISERFPIDTLVSTQTGQIYVVDSVSSESYSMDYFSDQIRVDASLLFRTNPEARWSLYGGVGFAAGVSINASTELYYYNAQSDDDYHGRWEPGFGSQRSEQFRNETNFGFMTYIPLGVDFRLGNNKEFWKRTHLFYEVSPGINFTAIPELTTFVNPSIRNGFGLRVNWE
ncbi:MAG: hypothetical protein WBG42_13525 [Cryomorphaceae bacterium]